MAKKLLPLLLALVMLFSLTGVMAFADDAAPSERSADIVILYTSDVHCGINQGFGYAGLAEVYKHLEEQGNAVILVDDGDNIQGEPVGTMTKGEALVDLMGKVGYSVAIPGNHEFDYGMDQFLDLAKNASFTYISCNFNREGELIFDPYVIRELDGVKVAFVGVTTPQTLISSTPRYFQNEEGEYIYGFFQDETGEGVYNAVQNAVDSARAEGAEYVVVLAHLGNEEECRPWTYADVISHVSGIDVLLDGHSHDTDQIVMKDKDGKDVLRSACGTKLAHIGYVRITTDGKISTGLYNWNNDESAPALLGIQNDASAYVEEATGALQEKLKEVVATSQVLLTIYDPVAVTDSGSPIRMVRRAETNLGDLCADAYLDQSGADVAFVNGGGIRVNINAGDITLNDILKVHPFGNAMCVIEVTGQQILDALEWGAHAIPGENGGFLQVAGLSYEIHSYIESPCQSDENSLFTGIEGERRVQNVLIGGEPIDPEATYTLASHNYMLLDHGDGYTMFDGAPLLQDSVKLDNQVLIDYITGTLGGVIGPEYEDLTGQGRIVIVQEKP